MSSTARSLGATCQADNDRGTGCDLEFRNGGSQLTNCRAGNFQLVEDCTIDTNTDTLTTCSIMDGCTIGSTEAVESSTARSLGATCLGADNDRTTGL